MRPSRRWLGRARGVLGLLAALFGFGSGCTATVRDGPERPGSERPDFREVPGIAPDAPAFLALPNQDPSLLYLTPAQLEAHLGDVLAADLSIAAQLPLWSPRGDIGNKERLTALHDVIDDVATAVGAARGQRPFVSCAGDRACLADAVRTIGEPLQRRTLSSDEIDAYLEVFDTWVANGDRASAERALLESLIVSPFTTMQHDRFRDRGSHRGLALWSTPADPSGADPVEDPRFERHVAALLLRWLWLTQPHRLTRTLENGTMVDEATRTRLFDELVGEVATVIRSGGTFADLFRFGSNELGVLGAPYALLNHSAGTHRSIVFRGLYVLRALLCIPVEFPSDSGVQQEIEDFMDETRGNTEISAMAVRHASPTCRSCHMRFDGFGLRLNDFDMLGALARQSDETASVEAAIPGWREPARTMQTGDPQEVAEALSTNSVARACFARAWAETLVDGDLGSLDPEAYGRLVNEVVDGQPLERVLHNYLDGLQPVRSDR